MGVWRMAKITNILVLGVGGQGIMTASEVLAKAVVALGHDVKKSEVAGMAQRGGVVASHLRFGPKVLSPQVAPGTADILLGFEAAEGLRWNHMLRPGGLALLNTGRLVPPVVNLGFFEYPQDPFATMRETGTQVFTVDATAIAKEIGDARLGNSVMLGKISEYLPFPAEVLEECLLQSFATKKPEIVELNRKAFAAGRELAKNTVQGSR